MGVAPAITRFEANVWRQQCQVKSRMPAFARAGSNRIQGNPGFIYSTAAPNLTVTPTTSTANRLLYGRKTAAAMLSISLRTFDYYLADGKFQTRRIARNVLIPHGELVRFARADHFGPVSERASVVRRRSVASATEDNMQEVA